MRWVVYLLLGGWLFNAWRSRQAEHNFWKDTLDRQKISAAEELRRLVQKDKRE